MHDEPTATEGRMTGRRRAFSRRPVLAFAVAALALALSPEVASAGTVQVLDPNGPTITNDQDRVEYRAGPGEANRITVGSGTNPASGMAVHTFSDGAAPLTAGPRSQPGTARSARCEVSPA